MKKMDLSDELVIRIRALQSIHNKAHQALLNWSRWSRDCPPIGRGIAPPVIWDQFKRDENDDYGGDHEIPAERLAQTDTKPEPHEKEPYNGKEAEILNERIHSPGFPEYLRLLLRHAYITRYLPEHQFPHACGCPPHAFCERLESALIYVGRFV